MSADGLAIILDILVLVLLASTIFFAGRLSLHLRDFRQNRQNMDRILRELAGHIAKAEQAVHGMRESARESGRDLQSRINEARAMVDELNLMTQSGNNIAKRMEKSVDRGRRPRASVADPLPSFMIRDSELEGVRGVGKDMSEDDEEGGLPSRAERELFEALRRKEAGGVS